MTMKYNLLRTTTSDFSSDCDCSNCLESPHSESDYNPCSSKSDDNDSFYLTSRKKSKPPSSRRCFPSHCCPAGLESDNKKGPMFLSSEEESESAQNKRFGLNLEGMPRKTRALRERTVEELVRDFGDRWTRPPRTVSVGHFRDQAVVKFRRALYYSGIWVTHAQGNRLEKHFSANFFKRNPDCLKRLVPWLKRELTAMYGDYGYGVKNIVSAILRHMTEYDLDSESFIHFLEPYLQPHTHHFLHEFISFVHSPYNMETYDQRAIYRCCASPWEKQKSAVCAPVLPLPTDQALLAAQQDTKQSKNTRDRWVNEQRPLSGMKPFPNGNSSSKGSEMLPVHHKAASKTHDWIEDKPDSGDHKGTISTNNILLNCAMPWERGSGLQNCKQKVQDEKEGIKLFPGHVWDLEKGTIVAHNFSSPAIFNQGDKWKYNLRERKVLSPGQHTNVQEKAEQKQYSYSLPKIFQRRLPRERSWIRCKSRKRDPSWSCISENTFSSERDGRKLSSFRKRRMKCRQSSHFAEIGSHASRGLQRKSRSITRRSKSWCVRLTKRSVSRESSNSSLRGSHRSERFIQNRCCEPAKEKNVHSSESSHQRASSIIVQYMKLPSNAGKKPKCPSQSEGASQAGSHCNSPICLQIEKHRSPCNQEVEGKTTFPIARKTRVIRHINSKCQCPGVQTTEKVSDEVRNPKATRQASSLSEGVPSYRRQIQKKKT